MAESQDHVRSRLLAAERKRAKMKTKLNYRPVLYPPIQQRGFYSDLITDTAKELSHEIVQEGPKVYQDTLWDLNTEKYLPNVFKLQITPEEVEKQLENQIYGLDTGVFTKKRRVGESCVSGVDFSAISFLPKVQLAMGHQPGQKPRNIEIERLRRLYARLDLVTLLRERGVDPDLLMPKQQTNLNVILMQDPADPAPFPPYLPLTAFDNTEFDCCTPDEWIKLGETYLALRPVPAVCFLPEIDSDKYKEPTDPSIKYKWVDAGVLDYCPKKDMYYVQKVDDNCRVLDPDGNRVVNKSIDPVTGKRIRLPNHFWVERIRCMFRAEDPRIFADRLNFAFRARKQCEAELRYTLYVDCMPMDGLGKLSQANLDSIEWRVSSTPKLVESKRIAETRKKLLKEVTMEYCWVMNKFILDEEVRSKPSTFAFVTVPVTLEQPVGQKGCIEIPEYEYQHYSDSFAYSSIYTSKKSVHAMRLVRAECNTLLGSMSLFNFRPNKMFKLDEFEVFQSQTTTMVSNYLREIWVNNLKLHIRRCFMEVRRGWFNIYETDWRIYQISKLKKFMEVVKFTMQDTLRFLVMDSLNSLTRHILDFCYSTLHCRKGYRWGKSLMESPFPPRKIPTLFTIDLMLDSKVHFSIDSTRIAAVIDNLFIGAINGAQNVLQLEVLIMQDIFWAESPTLEAVSICEEPVRALRNIIRDALESSLIPLNAYAHKYDTFLDVMNLDIKQYTRDLEERNPSAKDIEKLVLQHLVERDRVWEILPYNIIIGPFYVNTEIVRDQIAARRQELANAGLSLLAKRIRVKIDDMADGFREMMGGITDQPNCIENLFQLREWINDLSNSLDKQRDRINVLLQDFVVLDEHCYNLSEEDYNAKIGLIAWPLKVEDMIQKKLQMLEVDEDRYLKQLDSDTMILNERIDNAQISVAAMAEFHDLNKVHEYANEMRRMAKNLRECQDLSALYNSREKLFKMKPTSYARLGKLSKDFEPFRKLWMTASDWQRLHEGWLSDPLSAINSEELERCVTDSFKTMHKFSRYFASIPAVQDVAVTIRSNIEAFKPYVPLIQAMTNPGLKERHWELLSDACNMKLGPSPTLTFTKCLDKGLDEFTDPISKISDVAAKEYAIEMSLNKMEADWENIEFEVIPYKTTGTYMVKTGDEVSQQIDDHIVLTQSMTFSPFKKPFEERIAEWEATLKLTQEVLESMLAVQRSWLYLEPIFSSDDITKQLPTEASRFQTMTRIWRKLMRNAKSTPQVIKLCPDETMLADLKKCSDLLDHVQKGLSDYLETKRSRFPRFFFLSDDELLEVLSQTKDPTAVQPHLRKCFENIAWLKFEPNMRISEMRSGEGENVVLCEELYPVGNVEDWLSEIERVMRETIRHIIAMALPDYQQVERTSWVLKWPGQVVIAVCQTYWSAEVGDALDCHGMSEYWDKLLEQLDGLRNLVRKNISRIGRMTLSALIVVEVHARDVVDTLMNEDVQDRNAFEWISQLRYYWKEDNNLYQRAVNAEFPYGYEYLGNTPRLVITPLTDRCYLTLTGALNLLFGGAPAGPAGTGKTETTKDLGKAFAIQCVVFNCSDQLDFMAMGKFFKGLASAGAWACFDEFNRIDIEVLSVVAQQIATIQNAQRAQMDIFVFEGLEIALKPSCAVFITMNPGYAGRTELPDNLKALFRPVAMMVPDYALIAEISLFSFGFGEARVLAKKIVTTFKLSSEQLSSQDHYDFGMRAVKSVISAAGNLKRMYLNMDEQLICLRAIQDVNIPKFLADDLKLFNGIVSDLFPNIQEEPIDYGMLDTSLRSNCIKDGILDTEEFIHKCIQLYETTVVRHGLMLVGTAGAGKTKCYKTLQSAQTELKGQPNPSLSFFATTHTYVLNPKSITMGQLYGEFDLYTHEWTDGILSTLIRVGTTANDEDKRWYVFDGPVDAVWIENMNTVLDDNKKLCLSSGEIIKLTDNMTMMFEVADLSVASPATVSRCGMVYMGTNVVGIKPIVQCWLKTIPQLVLPYADTIDKLFDHFFIEGLSLLRNELTEVVPTLDSCLVFGILNILTCFMNPLKRSSAVSEDNIPLLAQLIEPWFAFAFVWSVGATCDNNGRHKMSEWMRQQMKAYPMAKQFPTEGLVYDYRLDDAGIVPKEGRGDDDEEVDDGTQKDIGWVNWMSGKDAYTVTSDMSYSDIMVPTIDTIRSTYFINMFVLNKKKLLVVGTTGTGKTLTVLDKLTRGLPDIYLPEFINFSAKTSANQTQDLIDGKLDKRRKGIYGPPVGRYNIFFIDDLNMPALETYGAQPPIELIRQYMDFQGWYDRKAIGEFRTLTDVNVLSAMGPPGGGRNPVTARLLRHFNFLVFTEMERDSMFHIFRTILHFWIANCGEAAKFCDKIVQASIEVYNEVQVKMLPTPAKSHYTFNLRDLSKVFQGMLMGDHEQNKTIQSTLRLWYHESCRVFQDRLVDDSDRKEFEDMLLSRITNVFKLDAEKVIGERPVLYADFMVTEMEPRPYLLLDSLVAAQKSLEDSLGDYNQYSTKKMPLVVFKDALVHISRITRILRQPQGNALLLGMGGSGRQSLTRLSAFVSDFDCFQIELAKNYGVNEWHEDLKKVMTKAGLRDEVVVFLFSDTQIKNESFLEDLNNILNTGDVPNLYGFDEMENIFKVMKPVVMEKGLPPTKAVMFSTYTKKVKSNLHTVITMSPLGEIFRARLRQFPALVNCCTIDWFSEWPTEALQSVALRFLYDTPDLAVDQKVTNGLVAMCQEIHESVSQNSIRYLEEMSRYNYVTPTSFLELLGIYSQLVSSKKRELVLSSQRLKTGLDKINSTTVEVARLQEELEQMSPELEKAVAEATVTMGQIEKDTAVAEVTKAQVQVEERAATEKATETEAIAQDAQKDLDEALPALEAALSSLKSLNKNDVIEVRALQRPPMGVKLVMEAVCIMKGLKPKKVPGEKPGQKIDDYWDVGKTLLTEPQKFLDSLFAYDRDNIPTETIRKIAAYSENPNFTPEAIAKVSKACTSLCQWTLAMEKYHFVAVTVAPKREKLRIAKEELEATERILAEAKGRLHEVEAGVQALQSKYNVCMNRKQTLEDKCKLCVVRLDRADKLISSLADEKGRWGEAIKTYDELIVNVPGDILISAGFVSYLGPFTSDYRHRMVSEWNARIKLLEIPASTEPTLTHTMSDPVKIRNWQICGLPGDSYSTENGVIVSLSRRWPLFIDPQGQANKWIKNMEASNELDVIKQSSKDLIRSLENAIRFGKSCLMENVGSDLDPALDPVLLRQTYKQQGTLVIKMGDNIVPYHQDFKFFMTTKLPNPHYTPEVSIKVALINFTLSPSGLEEQLLGTVVAEERPDLEELKNQLIVNNAQMKGELKAIEDKILYLLSASQGSPVDDLDLIETLDASKITSTEIYHKMITTEETERNIDQIRSRYIPVATNAQVLFFCVGDMAKVDPMYQYSLEWFITIFLSGIAQAERGDSVEQRVDHINEHFTFSLFINVCRSLFEKHKLLFGLLMCVRLQMQKGKIDMDEWRWLIAGGTSKPKELPNPAHSWLSARSWDDILTLQVLPNFETFPDEFGDFKRDFKKMFDNAEPQSFTLPGHWATDLDDFQSILVLKALRPDKVTNAMQKLVAQKLGQQFIEPHQTDLGEVFKDSSPAAPLVFVLSTGTDPAKSLYAFAHSMKFQDRLNACSLGQGQGPIAEHLMHQAMDRGGWVFFQNCHLAPSWMPRLERLVEQIDLETVHKDFRLWLTSMPSPNFPVYILQNSSKMTVEPPKGIKANLLRSYMGFTDKYLKHCVGKTKLFKHLLLSICIFHAVCLERRKFGALGFNIPYEFTDGDLRICIDQLSMFLQEYTDIPYKVLVYTAGHINYGGRITDDWDRRCLMNILDDFYNSKVVSSTHKYSNSGIYKQLTPDTEINGYLEYIRTLPINDTPEIFGLHDNANITFAQNETSNLLGYLVELQPKSASGKGHSREEVMENSANSILDKVPHPVDFKMVTHKYPVKYEQSMNTVLAQEVIRYNRLLSVIRHSLKELLKALKGWVVMSQQLENMANSLFVNTVPAMWASKAYPSLKPLAAWVTDLVARMAFINEWVNNDTPPVFWISGFFFPQAFLTGTLQNFARRLVISIDRIGFDFKVMKGERFEPPSKGCYINGLYLEGARWDRKKQTLGESHAKELYTEMPVVWLIPSADTVTLGVGTYDCPVYKTLTRAGTLSTTGHSTNFVFTIRLPSDQPEKHWIKRGLALMCALNY